MYRFGKWIARHRVPILIVGLLLLIPSIIGIAHTRVNYDLLYYLPDDLETVRGEDILLHDFGKGAFSLIVIDGMDDKDVSALRGKIEAVDHVESALWYDSIVSVTVPKEILPDSVSDAFAAGDSTLMAVFFDDSASAESTMDAIAEIRGLAGRQCFVSGISAVVTDTKDLINEQEARYVMIAVLLACAVLALTMESLLLPILFLFSIGVAIVYNMGSNAVLGEISYITKAIAAVLQLAVTLDYSIFLWHSYSEQKQLSGTREEAMAKAIELTLASIVGSSLTTVAGFLSLCFMSFALGRDLGIVMSKGVVLGVVATVTVLPCLILIFDRPITSLSHKPLLPSMDPLARFVTKHRGWFIAALLLLIVPALYGYHNVSVYYDMSHVLPDDLDSIVANRKLSDEFDMSTMHLLLVDSDMSIKDMNAMAKEIEALDGVKYVLGQNALIGPAVPSEFIPEGATAALVDGDYQLMLIASRYVTSTDEINAQIDEINAIVKRYDSGAMLIGEAPLTQDLISLTDRDFKLVSIISIAAIFLIILFVLKSISLPVVLVSVIEFAIFVNLGIPYFTGTTLPFIASILISTIQLGSTVDYAILTTTRYQQARRGGMDRHEAVRTALSSSAQSILVSGLGFFAATIGVGIYSDIDIISSMCLLMARGAILSVAVVLTVLPSLLLTFDALIIRTSLGLRGVAKRESKGRK